jgi:uncharacterized protein with PIN domain
MIVQADLLFEILTGGRHFAEAARALDKAKNPAVTPLTLATVARRLFEDHEIDSARAQEIVDELVAKAGLAVVPLTREMLRGVLRMTIAEDAVPVDDAFTIAAAETLNLRVLGMIDLVGLDGEEG